LRKEGKEPHRHVLALRSWSTHVILVSRHSVSRRDAEILRRFCTEMSFDAVYHPWITAREANRFNLLPRAYYYEAACTVLHGKKRSEPESLLHREPPTDYRPYLFHFLKPGNIPRLLRAYGLRWLVSLEWSYALAVLAWIAAGAGGIILVGFPTAGYILLRRGTSRSPGFAPAIAYFFLIGAAYLFVEFVAVQRAEFVFRDRTFAAGVVVTAFLTASGLGSFLSRRAAAGKNILLVQVLTVAAVPAAGGFLVTGGGWLLTLPRAAACILVVGACVLCGGLMGTWFPLGMRALGRADLIPWAWAYNGAGSVLGMTLAGLVALEGGEWVVLGGAAAFYLGAALCFRLLPGER